MSRVIVERLRRGGVAIAAARAVPLDDLPQREGMRACGGHTRISGGGKEPNENLAPLRRCERQVGRPWDKVYAEIALCLRASSTAPCSSMSVIISPISLPSNRGAATGGISAIPATARSPSSRLWYQSLYVDETDGILKRN
jgi:hypothetical protein